MKYLILLLTIFSSTAFSAGQIVLEPHYNFNTDHTGNPTLGYLGIENKQPFFYNLAQFNTYLGMGHSVFTDKEAVNYYTLRNGISFFPGARMSAEVGVSVGMVRPDKNYNNFAYGRLTYKLW